MNRLLLLSLFSISFFTSASQEKSTTTVKASAEEVVDSLSVSTNKEEVVPEKPMLTGSAELGFLYKTGNTHSADLKSGLDLRFEKDKWISLLSVDLLIKKADVKNTDNDDTHFQTTDEKWTITSQTNYTFDASDKDYMYGNYWFEDSKTNSFVNQTSISTGWGRHWYKTSVASLYADIGPGYKRDVIKAKLDGNGNITEPEVTNGAFIIQAQALYIRKLNEHVEFKQFFSTKFAPKSGENDVYKAETMLTTKLISTLQLKVTLTIDYNSVVDENKENMDVQTAAALVYGF